MRRVAYIDQQLLAREFITGDVVRKTVFPDRVLSPFVGRVLFSNTATGTVRVQWPWGDEQEAPEDLVRDRSGFYVTPVLDTSCSTWESSKYTIPGIKTASTQTMTSRIASEYERRTMPLWRAACEAWYCGLPEIKSYVKMASVFGPQFGQEAVRLTVSNVYEHGRRLAIYWGGGNRKYRVTKSEKKRGKLGCPRCKSELKHRTYRAGQRLLMCGGCGFSIHPRDIRVSPSYQNGRGDNYGPSTSTPGDRDGDGINDSVDSDGGDGSDNGGGGGD